MLETNYRDIRNNYWARSDYPIVKWNECWGQHSRRSDSSDYHRIESRILLQFNSTHGIDSECNQHD